jgi:uridine kinase
MLADELAEFLRSEGRQVIRASIDGFHNPREIRMRQGHLSPRGYYEDSFDLQAIKQALLLPLGPNGDLRFQVARFDFRRNTRAESPWMIAESEAILVFEGVFLHRPELATHFDFTIFVDASFDVTLQRALTRDRELFGSEENTRYRYMERYIPGQVMYLEECDPSSKADLVFENNVVGQPKIIYREQALNEQGGAAERAPRRNRPLPDGGVKY